MLFSPSKKKLLAAAPFLVAILLSSIACDLSLTPAAAPTPTFTPNPTSTVTPTPTFAPILTPAGLLTSRQRSGYTVILRSPDAEIHERLYAISGYLHDRGYETATDSLQSDVGSMDIILYGDPSCLEAIDDLTAVLKGRLDLEGVERRRFGSDDAYYAWPHIVIQITSVDRFSSTP
jgi:hypothetical protein